MTRDPHPLHLHSPPGGGFALPPGTISDTVPIMEDPPPSTDLRSFYAELLGSFENLFVHRHCKDDIVEICKALEQARPIANLVQSKNGSFSTIFLPFHSKQTYPFDFGAIASAHSLHPKFLQFCALAGKIEGLTGTMGVTKEEPSANDKNKLLPLLKEFLAILPSAKEFKTWLQ